MTQESQSLHLRCEACNRPLAEVKTSQIKRRNGKLTCGCKPMSQEQIIRQIRVANHNNLGPLGRALVTKAESLRDLQVRFDHAFAAFGDGKTKHEFLDEWLTLSLGERNELLSLL